VDHRFSTRDVHPRDRLAYWQDVACKAFVELECRTPTRTSFNATIASTSLADIGVSLVDTDQCDVYRRRGGIARAASEDVLVSLQLAGASVLTQDGRQAHLAVGDLAVYDTMRPYALRVSPGVRQLVLKLPRRQLEQRLGSVVPHTARPIRGDGGLGAFTSGFLNLLAARMDAIAQLDAQASHYLKTQVVELISSALWNAIDVKRTLSRELTLARLKMCIEQHLADPSLKPIVAADAAGISVRYANDLLASERFSLERFILKRRLERCAAALADPRQVSRGIGDIALSCGFSDQSHFGRRFRERFGLSPRDYRRGRPIEG
jgi:AraC family transcriptional activator of tynA and feaB